MSRRWIGLAAALLSAGTAATTSMAAGGVLTGERLDPEGDATAAIAQYANAGSGQLVDIRRVQVAYDSGTGSLRVDYEGSLTGVGHAHLLLGAALAAPGPTGACSDSTSGDYRVEGSELARAYIGASSTAKLYGPDGQLLVTGSYFDVDQTHVGPRLTFDSPALAGLDLRCVHGVYASKQLDGFDGFSRDDVDPFCLGLCPAIRAPVLQRAGDTLTWDRVGDLTSYVVGTSTAPEGSPARSTSYATVSGTSFSPPVADGETRYYSVRANVEGASWSRPEVAVTYPPTAVPPEPKGPGPVAPPGGTPPVMAPGIPPVAGPPAGVPTPVTISQDLVSPPTLSAAAARTAAAKALAARFRTTFRRRSAKGFRLTCTVVAAHASCQAQWRYRKLRYRGSITLTARAVDGRSVASVTRLVVRRG